MRAEPTLSVVIPVRNRPQGLAQLLADFDAERAALGPSGFERLEVIVVDDASDPPVAAARAAATLVRAPRRLGANGARRLGLERAGGRFVHFHDSDDGLEPGWLRATLAGIDAQPRAALFVTRRIDEIGGACRPRAQHYAERRANRPDSIARMLALRNCLGPYGGVIAARSLLLATPFPDIPSSQDWAVYLALYRAHAPLAAAIPQARFIYRRDGSDRISASPRRKALGIAAIRRRVEGRGLVGRALKLHHLHGARSWLQALDRPALTRILRATRVSRRAAHWAVTLWAVAALGLR